MLIERRAWRNCAALSSQRSTGASSPVSIRPSIRIWPCVGRSSRLMQRTRVDLPAPLIPTMPKISPSVIVRLIPSRAVNSPSPVGNRLERFRISITVKTPLFFLQHTGVSHSRARGIPLATCSTKHFKLPLSTQFFNKIYGSICSINCMIIRMGCQAAKGLKKRPGGALQAA